MCFITNAGLSYCLRTLACTLRAPSLSFAFICIPSYHVPLSFEQLPSFEQLHVVTGNCLINYTWQARCLVKI